MKLFIPVFLLLTSCATTNAYINCENAAKLKLAAQTTIDAVNYACPIGEPIDLLKGIEN